MKKIAFWLAALLLLASLAGCGRRQEILNQIESEKVAESAAEESRVLHLDTRPRETVGDHPETSPLELPSATYPNGEGYRLTGVLGSSDKGYYDTMTFDSLKDKFGTSGMINSFRDLTDTPTGVILTLSGTSRRVFNKLTGNITMLCPDPLCNHKNCAWSQMFDVVFTNETHIYFACGEYGPQRLFRSDLERNHVEDVGCSLNDGADTVVYAKGDLVYLMHLDYVEGSAGRCTYGVFDCGTKEFTRLSGEDEVYIHATTGETIWYSVGVGIGAPLYRADPDFSNSERAFADLNESVSILSYSDDYMILAANNTPKYLYNVQTKEIKSIEGRLKGRVVFDGQYAYYTKAITEAEMASSPLKDYFGFTYQDPLIPEQTILCQNMDAGRIYRLNLETLQEELVMELSFDGVPVKIDEILVDGDAVFVKYLLWSDYKNYYNQDYGKPQGGTGLWSSGTSHEPYRYLYVDMQNGTVHLLNSYALG